MPPRWYHGTFTLTGRRVRLPTARGCPPLWLRLSRDLPYPAAQVRSVILVYQDGRWWLDVTAEVPVATYPPGRGPDPTRVAGVDLGIIHPYAVAGPDGDGLLVSGRAIRAEHHLHLTDTKQRRRTVARRAPTPGRATAPAAGPGRAAGRVGSRRWRAYRRRSRVVEARHRRGHHRPPRRRTRLVLDLPHLPPADPEAIRTDTDLPTLPLHRPPRPDRRGHHRHPHPGRRTPHPHGDPAPGDHAPSSRPAPTRRRPDPA